MNRNKDTLRELKVCLPFVRGDESDTSFHYQKGKLFALRKRG